MAALQLPVDQIKLLLEYGIDATQVNNDGLGM